MNWKFWNNNKSKDKKKKERGPRMGRCDNFCGYCRYADPYIVY